MSRDLNSGQELEMDWVKQLNETWGRSRRTQNKEGEEGYEEGPRRRGRADEKDEIETKGGEGPRRRTEKVEKMEKEDDWEGSLSGRPRRRSTEEDEEAGCRGGG